MVIYCFVYVIHIRLFFTSGIVFFYTFIVKFSFFVFLTFLLFHQFNLLCHLCFTQSKAPFRLYLIPHTNYAFIFPPFTQYFLLTHSCHQATLPITWAPHCIFILYPFASLSSVLYHLTPLYYILLHTQASPNLHIHLFSPPLHAHPFFSNPRHLFSSLLR